MPMVSIISLPFIVDVLLLFLALVIGLYIFIFIVKVIMFVLPAALVALIVWFFTASMFLAGVAFLFIALLIVLR